MGVIKLLIALTICSFIWIQSANARDPNVPEPPRYGERPTLGGSEWTGGDTFLAITIPLAIAALIALPHIFSGNDVILYWDEQIPRNISGLPHYKQMQLFPPLGNNPSASYNHLCIFEPPTDFLYASWKKKHLCMVTSAFVAFDYFACSEHGCRFSGCSVGCLTRFRQYDRFGEDRHIGGLVLHDAYIQGDDPSDFCRPPFWHTKTNSRLGNKHTIPTGLTTHNQHHRQRRIYPELRGSLSWMKYNSYNLKCQGVNAQVT